MNPISHSKSNKNLLPPITTRNNLTQNMSNKIEQASEYEEEHYMGVNQVLVYSLKGGTPTYYVPAYLRMRINRVNEINYIYSKAEIET